MLDNFDVKLDNIPGGEPGLTEVFGKKLDPSMKKCLRFWPKDTQGFFAARLIKQ